jgi:rhodanese-related sulfurtransferase
MRRGTLVLLIILAVVVVGLGAALVAGRPLAFAVVHWKTARKFPQVQWIRTDSLARWMGASLPPRPLLLDARTKREFEVSQLEGAQRIDPYYPSFRLLKGVPADSPIVVYSSVGYRSARVAQRLAQEGFTRVLNMRGGIFQWANDGLPLMSVQGPMTLVHPYNADWGLMLKRKYRITAPDLPKQSAAP